MNKKLYTLIALIGLVGTRSAQAGGKLWFKNETGSKIEVVIKSNKGSDNNLSLNTDEKDFETYSGDIRMIRVQQTDKKYISYTIGGHTWSKPGLILHIGNAGSETTPILIKNIGAKRLLLRPINITLHPCIGNQSTIKAWMEIHTPPNTAYTTDWKKIIRTPGDRVRGIEPGPWHLENDPTCQCSKENFIKAANEQKSWECPAASQSKPEVKKMMTQGFMAAKKLPKNLNASLLDLSNQNLSNFQLLGIDLTKANLQGANLSNANLKNARLTQANLKGINASNANLENAVLNEAQIDEKTNFEKANLTGVSFDNLDLQGVNFKGSNLTNAKLADAKINEKTNFANANLSNMRMNGLNLSGINFGNAQLKSADLTKTNIAGTSFKNAKMQTANLEGAQLDAQTTFEGAHLRYAKLKGLDLSNKNLEGVELRYANLTGANLSGTKLKNADLRGATLTNATITDDTDFSGTKINKTMYNGTKYLTLVDFLKVVQPDKAAALEEAANPQVALIQKMKNDKACQSCDLKGANLTDTDLQSFNLEKVNLSGANLSSAKLNKANLQEANLTSARAVATDFTDADLRKAQLSRARLDNAILKNANLQNASLKGAKINGADLSGADLSNTDLSGSKLKNITITNNTKFDGATVLGMRYDNKVYGTLEDFLKVVQPDKVVTATATPAPASKPAPQSNDPRKLIVFSPKATKIKLMVHTGQHLLTLDLKANDITEIPVQGKNITNVAQKESGFDRGARFELSKNNNKIGDNYYFIVKDKKLPFSQETMATLVQSTLFKVFKDSKKRTFLLHINSFKDSLSNKDFSELTFDLNKASFSQYNFENSKFDGLTMQKVRFNRGNLKNTSFKNTDLKSTTFKASNITNADFSGADLTGTNFKDSIIDGAKFDGATFKDTIWIDGSKVDALPGE